MSTLQNSEIADIMQEQKSVGSRADSHCTALLVVLLLPVFTFAGPPRNQNLSILRMGTWQFPSSVKPNGLRATKLPGYIGVRNGPLARSTTCVLLVAESDHAKLRSVCELPDVSDIWFLPDERRIAGYSGKDACWKLFSRSGAVTARLKGDVPLLAPLWIKPSADSQLLFGHFVESVRSTGFRPRLFRIDVRRGLVRLGPAGAYPLPFADGSGIYYLKYDQWHPKLTGASLCHAKWDWSRERVLRRFAVPVVELAVAPRKTHFAAIQVLLSPKNTRRQVVTFAVKGGMRRVSRAQPICSNPQFSNNGLLAYAAWNCHGDRRHSLYVADVGDAPRSQLVSASMPGVIGCHCWAKDGNTLVWIEEGDAQDPKRFVLRAVRVNRQTTTKN